MSDDTGRYVRWVALEVTDEALYRRYRETMTPILESHGGRFDHDFTVSRVWRSSAGPKTNRVFAISFPDRAARDRFFADPAYRAVRSELFDPAVASSQEIATTTSS